MHAQGTTKSYLFRFSSEESPQDSEVLFQNVIAAMTEVEVNGDAVEALPVAATVALDRDGPIVILPVRAVPGWFHHVESTLSRHGVRCKDYL